MNCFMVEVLEIKLKYVSNFVYSYILLQPLSSRSRSF